jgi:hypothetical protein
MWSLPAAALAAPRAACAGVLPAIPHSGLSARAAATELVRLTWHPRLPACVALVSAFAPTPPTLALSSVPALALRPATSHAARGLTALSMAESKNAKVGARACVL